MKALSIGAQNARAIDTHWKSNPEKGMALFHAIFRFERRGVEPPTDEVSSDEWEVMKEEQLTVRRRADNGKNGGHPKGDKTNSEPNPNRTRTESKPNPNRTQTKTEPDKEGEAEGDRLSLPSVLKGEREGVSGDAPEPPPRARPSRFVPPTLEEVRAFWPTGGKDGGPLPGDPDEWFYYWESVGWIRGKGKGKPVKNWKALARNCPCRPADFAPTATPPPPKPEPDPYAYRGPLPPEEEFGSRLSVPRTGPNATPPNGKEAVP